MMWMTFIDAGWSDQSRISCYPQVMICASLSILSCGAAPRKWFLSTVKGHIPVKKHRQLAEREHNSAFLQQVMPGLINVVVSQCFNKTFGLTGTQRPKSQGSCPGLLLDGAKVNGLMNEGCSKPCLPPEQAFSKLM